MFNTNTLPTNFPVQWDNPADAQLTWRYDSHVTLPLGPLSFSMTRAVLGGFSHAFAQLGMPVQMRIANFNGYVYATSSPLNPPPPVAKKVLGIINRAAPALAKRLMARNMAAMGKKQLATIQSILTQFDSYWHDDLLPQNRQHLAFFACADWRQMGLPQLRDHLREALQRAEQLGKLHALAAFPAVTAMSLFEELYRELFPEATTLDGLRLLQGFDNKTVRGDRALWRLSRTALTIPVVQEILLTCEPEGVMAALAQAEETGPFLTEFDAYLQQYGLRLNHFGQLTEPSWREEPVTAVTCLQTYLTQPDSNPEAVQARLVTEREQAVAAARRKLAGQSATVSRRFENLLAAAQRAAGIKEDNHWIIQELLYQMRQLALAIGQRLHEAGELPAVEDLFYLTAEELLAGTRVTAADLQERKAARAHFRQVTPPPFVGATPSAAPAPTGVLFRAMRKTDEYRPQPSPDEPQMVKGQAASTGVVRGKARIILELAEASSLRPGEVLVTKRTLPPWTPLFGVATAVVTDIGGVLSHSAVVAREYGIPAVVGTGNATQIFRDGQLLEVNGTVGTVRVVN